MDIYAILDRSMNAVLVSRVAKSVINSYVSTQLVQCVRVNNCVQICKSASLIIMELHAAVKFCTAKCMVIDAMLDPLINAGLTHLFVEVS